MKDNVWLITGGSRSGKSRYALTLGAQAQRPFFIATGWAGDNEMTERIRKHQAERGPQWTTIETRTGLLEAIREAEGKHADFILVDCLTFWVCNLMEADMPVEEAANDLAAGLPKKIQTVFVTNEVGCGIVPENRMAREFRDHAGRVNQIMAAAADHVVLTVCGLPLTVK